MGLSKIEGVEIKVLSRHADDRGYLMEVLRRDDPVFEQFGQAYTILNYPGVIRAWHWHERQFDYMACVSGMLRVVLVDRRAGSRSQGGVEQHAIGDHNPLCIKIPPGVIHGIQTLGTEPALLLNLPTLPYDSASPDEGRLPYNDPSIAFDWNVKHR